MIGAEPIKDPNVVAYYAFTGAKIVVTEPPQRRSSWWARLFAWEPVEPRAEDHALRVGRTFYVSPDFRKRMDFYLTSFRLEARERRAGYEVDCCRRDGAH